ncbi:MAG: toprim domain-containing protein, partial [Ruminococcaceae bacterium]|nr:toprim domain-containing protein [Oscillospiraceae bacterium]
QDRTLILCEGYMDVIAVNQAGFQNAVATLGTALTSQQASVMKRYADDVIICYDADVDGFQIRTLLLTMVYRVTPTLIEEGKVFIAESPLYEITTKKKVYFAYTEAEKEKYIKEIGKEKFTVQRSKGLGENEPEMMNLTTMNPATRRLIKVMPDDVKRTAEMFDILLGDNLQGRKDYIVNHGAEYVDNLDLS